MAEKAEYSDVEDDSGIPRNETNETEIYIRGDTQGTTHQKNVHFLKTL